MIIQEAADRYFYYGIGSLFLSATVLPKVIDMTFKAIYGHNKSETVSYKVKEAVKITLSILIPAYIFKTAKSLQKLHSKFEVIDTLEQAMTKFTSCLKQVDPSAIPQFEVITNQLILAKKATLECLKSYRF